MASTSSPPRLGKARPTSIVPGGAQQPRAQAQVNGNDEGDATEDHNNSQDTNDLDGTTEQHDDQRGDQDTTQDGVQMDQEDEEEQEQDDDPNLLASYPIYLSNSVPETSSLELFQYPTYPRRQPLPVPSSSRQRGLQQAIRWRKNAGWVQVELPLDLRKSVYDEDKGGEMGRGAHHLGKEIGANDRQGSDDEDEDEKGGKRRKREDKKKGKSKASNMLDMDEEDKGPKRLEKIRLESDLIPNMTKYCVGIMRDHALHLTPLDRIVQLRPSMHHLDGLDSIEKEEKRNAARMNAQTDDEESEAESKPPAAQQQSAGYNISVRVASGGRDGGAIEKDVLMSAKHKAEAEDWIQLSWKDLHGYDNDRLQVQDVMSKQLFVQSRKNKLDCVTRPADYLPKLDDDLQS
ncbi:unnamed protein product [Sympodiomycopsis kandeliae]